jgi:hypothetical protein
MTTAVVWYAIGVGALMVVWWGMEVRAGALRRPDRTPAEIGLYLTAELLTAALLVVGGIVLLVQGSVLVALVALGMLLYTVIQSPGYFLARRELAFVAMFAVLVALTLAAVIVLLLD